MIMADRLLMSSRPVRRTICWKDLRAVLAGLHLHDDGEELVGELGVDELHLLGHAGHGLVEREAGAEHDAEHIHGVRQRLLKLGAVALHQPVQHLVGSSQPRSAAAISPPNF